MNSFQTTGKKMIAVLPRDSHAGFSSVPKHIDLESVCVVKEYWKIRNDHTFSYGNKFYLIESPLRDSIAKQKIELSSNHEPGFTAFLLQVEN